MAGCTKAEEQVEPWKMPLDLMGARSSVCPVLVQNEDVSFQCEFMTFPMCYQGKWEVEKQL